MHFLRQSFIAVVIMLTVATGLRAEPLGSSTLPRWLSPAQQAEAVLTVDLPAELTQPGAAPSGFSVLILSLDPDWQPDWRKAAFDLKSLIVTLKTRRQGVEVGLQATPEQADALMAHDFAAYVDAYVFTDAPFIPDGDPTGKLWQITQAEEYQVLEALLSAASIGIDLVLFQSPELTPVHQAFLETIAATQTGSLDLQPEIQGIPQERAHFFFDPATSHYQLAVYSVPGKTRLLSFQLDFPVRATCLFPENAAFDFTQYGQQRSEIRIRQAQPYYFFDLEPTGPTAPAEAIQIFAEKELDPYELVVRNQVFKDAEQQQFHSLIAEEEVNYRYQDPGGRAFDVTFKDTLFQKRGKPIERVRKELYLGGVKWPYDELPDLPLIQPEKIQREPLVIDLDRSYRYFYKGEDVIDGHPTWKVRFEPISEGKFASGTVWLDQETGAHRKLRAIQSGLEPPVIGNEVTAYYDWIEDQGQRYWTQVREESLLIVKLVGLNIAFQLDLTRSDYQFNRDDFDARLAQVRASDALMLQDTHDGLRYLKKKDGDRVVVDQPMTRAKLLLGGVFMDPALDYPLPLVGFNYTDIDFLDRGYQINVLTAGALNTVHLSNSNFLNRGWDLTAGLFLTAIYFGDNVYEGREKRDDLEVERLTEAVNVRLGIPITQFMKFTTRYDLDYLAYRAADDTDERFVIPQDTLEQTARFGLRYDRKRFSMALEMLNTQRSDWETWGLPEDDHPVYDRFRKLELDMAVNKRLKNFQTLTADLRYLKGWDLDRFSQFGFGFYENHVSGFGTSGIGADEAVRVRFGYDVGIKSLFQLTTSLDAARAWLNETGNEATDLMGLGLGVNFVGPWKTFMRVNVGYGLHASIPDEEGEFTGQILFLRMF